MRFGELASWLQHKNSVINKGKTLNKTMGKNVNCTWLQHKNNNKT